MFSVVATAAVGVFLYIINAIRRLIAWFDSSGFRAIVENLNTAMKYVDLAKSMGILDAENAAAYRNVVKRLNGLDYKGKLLVAGEQGLHQTAQKMETDMEKHLPPEPTVCCVM